MSKGFIKILREAQELFDNDIDAFVVLMQMAFRARWKDSPYNKDKLELGESLIGKKDAVRLKLNEQRYRDAKKRIEQDYKLATFRGTNKGTRGKFTDTRVCDLNLEIKNEQKNEQNNVQITRRRTNKERANNAQATPNEERKKLKKYKKDVVVFRGGGNVHNSQASSKHSPPSSNSSFLQKEEQQPSSSTADENETTFKLFSKISNFKLMDGKPLNDESIHRWASKRTTEDLLQILEWFDAMQQSKFAKTGEVLTEAYLEQGITQGWWKVWASRQFAKQEDKKQAERHRRNQ